MQRALLRARAWLRDRLKPLAESAIGAFAVAALRIARAFDVDRTAALFGRAARRLGPWTPEHKIGRANLKAAYPDKSDAEIEAILAGVWDNLGRLAAEFAQLDRLWQIDLDNPSAARIEFDADSRQRFEALQTSERPALIFAAHLANWELPALAAAEYGLDTAVLFRPPGIAAVSRAVQGMRAIKMGEMVASGRDAPLRLARALHDGRNIAMLVDQFYTGGVHVNFFGRQTRTNPLLARLLRQVEGPIHGTRVIRLPGNRFRVELSPRIAPVRDAAGAIDVQGTMQAITSVVEGWVREHPEQWLWLHRRWRDY